MATNLSNKANIRYTYSGSGSGSAVSNTTTTTLIDEYSISAAKVSLKGTFRPGENLTYVVRIENNGSGSLYGVTLIDNLGGEEVPALLSYIPGSAYVLINSVYFAVVPTAADGRLSIVLPSVLQAGDTAVIVYMVTVSNVLDVSVEEITNTAAVTGCAGSSTGALISVVPSPSATVQAENYAHVTIIKEADKSTVNAGDSLTYTFTLTNLGNEDAIGVVLSDELPSGFTISGIQSVTNGIVTTYNQSDYAVNPATNELTLPSNQSAALIKVPAASTAGPGITTIIISGTVS